VAGYLCGQRHVYPQVDSIPNAAHFKQPMLLFRNKHDGTFDEVEQTLASLILLSSPDGEPLPVTSTTTVVSIS